MQVADILRAKGPAVMTITPDETIQTLAKRLKDHHIGSLIVSGDGQSLDGIVSERDIAYGLAEHGSSLHQMKVSQLMTKNVTTCSREDSLNDVMKVMTQKRVRHLPVKDGSAVVGVVSIGDILKHRIEEAKLEANVMRDYAIAARR